MIYDEIEALSDRIIRANVRNAEQMSAILAGIGAIKSKLVGQVRFGHVVGCLEAAAAIARAVPHLTGGSFDEGDRLLIRLVHLVHNALGDAERLPEPSVAPQTQAAAPAVAAEPATRARPEQRSRRSVRLLHEMLLGELMVELGVLTEEDVNEALRTQKRTGGMFGDTLIRTRKATANEVKNALLAQENARNHAPTQNAPSEAAVEPPAVLPAQPREAIEAEAPDIAAQELEPGAGPDGLRLSSEARLGDVLRRLGKIKKSDLELALKLQRATGMLLGEALVEVGVTSWEDVLRGLRYQQYQRSSRGMFNPGVQAERGVPGE